MAFNILRVATVSTGYVGHDACGYLGVHLLQGALSSGLQKTAAS